MVVVVVRTSLSAVVAPDELHPFATGQDGGMSFIKADPRRSNKETIGAQPEGAAMFPSDASSWEPVGDPGSNPAAQPGSI